MVGVEQEDTGEGGVGQEVGDEGGDGSVGHQSQLMIGRRRQLARDHKILRVCCLCLGVCSADVVLISCRAAARVLHQNESFKLQQNIPFNKMCTPHLPPRHTATKCRAPSCVATRHTSCDLLSMGA